MKSRGQKLLCVFVCLLALTAGAVAMGLGPQSTLPAPATPTGGPAFTPPLDADRQIMLDVVVTDHSGKPVAGLQQQDFTVLDNKQRQTISSFSAVARTRDADDLLEQSVVLVDNINTPFGAIAFQRQQLDRFLRQADGELPLPMSLSILKNKLESQPLTTRDGNTLANLLDSAEIGLRDIRRSQGFFGAVERLQLSLEALYQLVDREAPRPGRKLVIWIGPGWPLLSGPGTNPTRTDQERILTNIVRLTTALRQARLTLYNVDQPGTTEPLSRSLYYEGFVKGVSSAREAQYGNLALQVLAVQSGGRVLNASNDLSSSIAACLSDARVFYTLAFEASAPSHPNQYHSLQVKMNKRGLTARTRTGYYAQP